LDILYQSVVQKKAVQISYQSFTARQPQLVVFSVWWLKEFRNRWFAVGMRVGQKTVQNLALDRIIDIQLSDNEDYIPNTNTSTTPEAYYKDVIGVTVSENYQPMAIQIFVTAAHAPYVETKSLHHSQQIIDRNEAGIVIELTLQHNFELEKEILSFGESMTVLEPLKLRNIIKKRLEAAANRYL
jgi:predicted DNA-binding transcriptional regulator YafY